MQVLFEARQESAVLEQRVLAAQVELEFLVGEFEQLRAPRAPLLQPLRDSGDIPGQAGPDSAISQGQTSCRALGDVRGIPARS